MERILPVGFSIGHQMTAKHTCQHSGHQIPDWFIQALLDNLPPGSPQADLPIERHPAWDPLNRTGDPVSHWSPLLPPDEVLCSLQFWPGGPRLRGPWMRAPMDPAGAAHLAKIAGYTEPHPEVKGDSSGLLDPRFY